MLNRTFSANISGMFYQQRTENVLHKEQDCIYSQCSITIISTSIGNISLTNISILSVQASFAVLSKRGN